MSQWSESKLPAMEELSSLMDGEVDPSLAGHAIDHWRADSQARATWHAYHLIGDVLRSDDLASSASHDAAFLATFRQRLAQEPVVLAPVASAPPELPSARRRSWVAPMAIAAGFVAVAGVLVVTQMSGGMPLRDAPVDATLAQAGKAPMSVVVAQGPASAAIGDPPSVVLDGQLIRDVRLDEYLAAHKKFGGSSALGGPSGFLRNAAADGTAR